MSSRYSLFGYGITAVLKNKSPTTKMRIWQPTWQPNAKLEAINVFVRWTKMRRPCPSQIIGFLSSGSRLRCSEPPSPSVLVVGPDRPTTCSSPSFFKSMDGLGQREVWPDALPGPMGFCSHTFFISYTHKPEVHDFIPLICYDLANLVMCVNK